MQSIYSLPHSGLLNFERHLLRCSSTDSTNSKELKCELSNEFGLLEQSTPANIGLFFTDPAVRLKRIYDNLVKEKHADLSFEAFYSDPSRINTLTLNYGVTLDPNIGFVGIEEHSVESMLLAQYWLNWTTTRITENDFPVAKVEVSISKADLEKIKALNEQDYIFYHKAKAHLAKAWTALVEKTAIQLPKDKNVIIHVGPPKTGTSSIQYYLNEAQEHLSSHDIYYPKHDSDSNNISSGNFQSVLRNAHQGRLSYVDDLLVSELVDKFLSTSRKTLLLSSEHFFYNLPALFIRFNQAKYIFYIRHPLAILESGYHQQIKRHGRTKELGEINKIDFRQVQHIQSLAELFSVTVDFRYFSPNLFEGGSIISDFSHAISIPVIESKSEVKINSKYTLEALELMRLCNKFASTNLLSSLDLWLQQFSETKRSQSLITKDINNRLQSSLLKEAERLTAATSMFDKLKLQALIEEFKPNESDGRFEEKGFVELISYMIKTNIQLAHALSEELAEQDDCELQFLRKQLTLSAFDRLRVKWNNVVVRLRSYST